MAKHAENLDIIAELLTDKLTEFKDGSKECSLDDILHIKAALNADRPTADFILATIFNEITFLNEQFNVLETNEHSVILRFLEAFLQYTQAELLGTVRTHKDGLTLVMEREE